MIANQNLISFDCTLNVKEEKKLINFKFFKYVASQTFTFLNYNFILYYFVAYST